MRAYDIIAKKRDGHALTSEEIGWFVQEFTEQRIPDYQAAAWLMAIFIRGMSREETVNLTLAMARSGEQLDLSDVVGFAVDKHSSGGVGDKTSLVVVPLVAAAGVPVAKMSGRGLGHTGGTLDKLESISGFRVELGFEEFKQTAAKHGIVLAGQSDNLAPADKALYALRDVTATVNSMPLIASSIMSKKLAAGADGVVLDVKVGRGAFMPDVEQGRELAQLMVNIGQDANRKIVALLSDMNQPLGRAAGLALEVREALETLSGGGPPDFREHCLVCAAHMLRLAGKGSYDDCLALAEKHLASGSGLEKFRQMVAAQDGDVRQVDNPDLLPSANFKETFTATAEQSGYVKSVDAMAVGNAVVALGGGRLRKSDTIYHGVGIITHQRVGNMVNKGDVLFTLHVNDETRLPTAWEILQNSVVFSPEKVDPLPLFYDTIYSD